MTQDKIDITAREILELYLKIRRREDPEYSCQFRDSNLAILRDAAVMCLGAKMTPMDFVKQQYDNRPGNTEFYLSMLKNRHTKLTPVDPNTITSYRKIEPTYVEAMQKKYLHDHIVRNKRNVEEILLDDKVDLLPWFRCLITDNPIPSVLKKYKAKARNSLYPELTAFLVQNKYDISRLQ